MTSCDVQKFDIFLNEEIYDKNRDCISYNNDKNVARCQLNKWIKIIITLSILIIISISTLIVGLTIEIDELAIAGGIMSGFFVILECASLLIIYNLSKRIK